MCRLFRSVTSTQNRLCFSWRRRDDCYNAALWVHHSSAGFRLIICYLRFGFSGTVTLIVALTDYYCVDYDWD